MNELFQLLITELLLMDSLDMSAEVVCARPKLLLVPTTVERTTIAIAARVLLWMHTSDMAIKVI